MWLAAPPFVQAQPAVPAESPAAIAPAAPAEATVSADIPDYHLTQTSLDGEIAADRVNLIVTIEVMINRGEGWRRVPLRLGALHVLRTEYSGPGEEAPETSPRGMEEGLNWLFKGIGKHQLKLHAWAPVKRTATAGQLQLALPTLPAQFEARLHLRIPDANVVVRPSKSLTLLDTSRANGVTTIDASVTGSVLALAWQTPVAGGESASLVQSMIHLKPSAEHLTLVVDQNIELQQAGLDHLLIRLPDDFHVVRASGRNYRSHEPVPGRPGWIKIAINNDSLGRVNLNWVLERELTSGDRTLRIEGFQVDGAIHEEGRVRIDEFENLRMIPRPADSEFVHRISVSQVRSLGTGVPLTAYEYVKQPFRLVFDVEPLAPHFTVAPDFNLRFEPDKLEFTARFPIHIDRGAISELRLNWPGWLQQGWRVTSVEADADALRPIAYDATSQPGVIRLWWPNPASQDATVSIAVRRPLLEQLAGALPLTLPAPQAPEVEPARIAVSTADQLTMQLTQADGRELPAWTAAASPLLMENQPPGAGAAYRGADLTQPFTAQVQTHQRTVQAATRFEIRSATEDGLEVDQILQLDVRYGRLRQLDLALPPALLARLPEAAVARGLQTTLDGKPLSPLFADGVLKVDLGQEKIGKFDVSIAYWLPVPADRSTQDVDLPVISIPDEPFRQAECQIDVLAAVQVRSDGAGWQALSTSLSRGLWINLLREGPLTSVPLTMGRKVADTSQQYKVDRVEVRTIFAADGSADSWAEFQLDGPRNEVLIHFPSNAEFNFNDAIIDGHPLSPPPTVHRGAEFDQVTFRLPQTTAHHPRLAVRYRTALERPFGLANQISLVLPTFPANVWVEQSTWEVQLPAGYHLFTYPDLVPQFHWVRRLAFWRREPAASYLAERAELHETSAPAAFQFPQHDFYPFRAFGSISQVRFMSMNRSLILLLGAGFALLLGFMFWRVPATRNVFSLVVISFLFAAAAQIYLQPILLLLQPAILGVALALAATVIDSASREPERPRRTADRSRPPEPPADDPSVSNVSTRVYRPVPAGQSNPIEG